MPDEVYILCKHCKSQQKHLKRSGLYACSICGFYYEGLIIIPSQKRNPNHEDYHKRHKKHKPKAKR